MISAKVICDSINENNERLTTFVVTFPKFILAEFNTHKMLSRNSASSRAIPSSKIMDQIKYTPFIPTSWGKAGKGMQAAGELDMAADLTDAWLKARDNAVKSSEELVELGLHKQLANRPMELWMYTTVLVSATEWENFFSLRAHPDAQPEFQELAFKMLEVYNESEPKSLWTGEWHIPFGDLVDSLDDSSKLKVATARAARVSYKTFEGEIDYEKDFELHDRLRDSGHWSPFEHCAQASPGARSGNFYGWLQYRKMFPTENRTDSRVVKKYFKGN